MSRLDVVLFGASGFTGRHAVEQLASIANQRGLSWAVAGRSRAKLVQILKNISDKTGNDLSSTKILIADVQNEQSVRDMCAQAKVLVNCCGPYILYGEVVVRAAIHSRAHYVDISGEPNFIEMMQLKYDTAAREAGVYVVSACAFESIPADLGVIFLQQNFGGILNSVECYLHPESHSQSVNYGTWNSLVHSLPQLSELPAIRKKLYPTPPPTLTPKLKYRFPLHKRDGGWCLPFPSNDTSAVYRTQRHRHQRAGARPAQFKLYVKFDSFLGALAVGIAAIFIYVMSQFKFTRDLLLKYASIFSLGLITDAPSDEVVENVGFEFDFYGLGWDESEAADVDKVPPRKSMVARVSGTNPGYGMTVAGVLYSAVVILEEQDKMPPGGGVVTPGVAFAHTALLDHLQRSGLTFRLLRSKLSRPHAD